MHGKSMQSLQQTIECFFFIRKSVGYIPNANLKKTKKNFTSLNADLKTSAASEFTIGKILIKKTS